MVYYSIAEKTGQISEITRIGFNKILKFIEALPRRGKQIDRISLRISKVYLEKPTFLNRIEKALKESNVSPTRLIFEIPQSALESADQQVLEKITKLKEMGIKIALVEFGFGYSSISALSDLDFDIVMIDKKFVDSITTSTKKGGILRSLIEMVERLEAEVICLGVEKQEQKDIIKKFGCSKMQGNLIGKPITMEDMLDKYLPKKPKRN
jgi:EAL domain-containing protein (putative c-di-GMP-specific phosphodiesterase class I)